MFIAYATVKTASTYQRSRGAAGLVGLSVMNERSCERCAEYYTIESIVCGPRPAKNAGPGGDANRPIAVSGEPGRVENVHPDDGESWLDRQSAPQRVQQDVRSAMKGDDR